MNVATCGGRAGARAARRPLIPGWQDLANAERCRELRLVHAFRSGGNQLTVLAERRTRCILAAMGIPVGNLPRIAGDNGDPVTNRRQHGASHSPSAPLT